MILDNQNIIYFLVGLLILLFLSKIPRTLFIIGTILKDSKEKNVNSIGWIILAIFFPPDAIWSIYVYKTNPGAKVSEYELINVFLPKRGNLILSYFYLFVLITAIIFLTVYLIRGNLGDDQLIFIIILFICGMVFAPYFFLAVRTQKTGQPNPLDRLIASYQTRDKFIKILIIIILISFAICAGVIFSVIFSR